MQANVVHRELKSKKTVPRIVGEEPFFYALWEVLEDATLRALRTGRLSDQSLRIADRRVFEALLDAAFGFRDNPG